MYFNYGYEMKYLIKSHVCCQRSEGVQRKKQKKPH